MTMSSLCRVALPSCVLLLLAASGCSRDVTLTDTAARQSPQAKLAIDFLGALRATDMETIGKLTTAELAARIRQENEQPTEETQELRDLMHRDLPADAAGLLGVITSVQTYRDRSVVFFETGSNTWFVQLTRVSGLWKVSAY